MATIKDLPNELLSQIFRYLASDKTLESLLCLVRVCKGFNELATAVLVRRLIISGVAFFRFDWDATPRFPLILHQNVQHLEIHLTGYERYECVLRHFGSIKWPVYDDFSAWEEALTDRLEQLARHLPQLQGLRSFKFSAQFRWVRARNTPSTPYLGQDMLCCLLQSLASCRFLEELELDTEDTEISNWKAAHNGIGTTCKGHVCPLIAKTIACLHKLRVFKLRRQDLCHEALLFFAPIEEDDGSTKKSTRVRLPHLRELVIDLRLPSTHIVERGVYEAATRPCACSCTCHRCVESREKAPKNLVVVHSQTDQIVNTFTEPKDDISSTLWTALPSHETSSSWPYPLTTADIHYPRTWNSGSAANKLRNEILDTVRSVIVPNLETNVESRDIKVLAYGNPQSEMINWTRHATIWDCCRCTVEDGEVPGLALLRRNGHTTRKW